MTHGTDSSEEFRSSSSAELGVELDVEGMLEASAPVRGCPKQGYGQVKQQVMLNGILSGRLTFAFTRGNSRLDTRTRFGKYAIPTLRSRISSQIM